MKPSSQLAGWLGFLVVAAGFLQSEGGRSLAQEPKQRGTLKANESRINSLAFAPDGGSLASAGADGKIRHWDLTANKELSSWKGPISQWRHVTFSADGKTLAASGGSDESEGAIVLYNLASGKDRLIYHGRLRISAVAFTKDGQRLAGVGEVGVMKLWNATTGKELAVIKKPTGNNNDDICAVEFSADEKTLITGSWDDTTAFWDVAGAKKIAAIEHGSSVWALAISKDKKTVAVGSQMGMISQWDVTTRAERGKVLRHAKKVWSLAYSPDGSRLASASIDGTWKLWDPATGKELFAVKEPAVCVAFSPDGKTVAVGRRDGSITLWDVARQGTLKEQVRGGIAFPPEKRVWTRITGKVKVQSAHSLLFEDGTEVDLNRGIDAPELEQKGLILASFYPCGKEAAEFLRKLIGDKTVTCYANPEHIEGKKFRLASAFVGETNLNIELVRNGWAVSNHSGMDAWEITARENKRGLWRGQFIVPKRWREGERLPGELGTRDPSDTLQPGYKVNDHLQLFTNEYRVTGPNVEKPGVGCNLPCTYSTRPVVMVYTRKINPPVIRLIKELNESTGKHQQERLGSYLVLVCDSQDREKELKAWAEKEKIQHTLLAMVVVNEKLLAPRGFLQTRFGPEAETSIILATATRRVKASYAYRKGELNDKSIDQVLADLPKIFPMKD
jgi:WD40 repeat protein/endonuclease YncB( thermonuclease family)